MCYFPSDWCLRTPQLDARLFTKLYILEGMILPWQIKKPAEAKVSSSGQATALPLPPGVKLFRSLEGHQHVVNGVAFDPQGERLASGSADHTVKVWDAQSGKLLRTLEGHTAHIAIVGFSPDGRIL